MWPPPVWRPSRVARPAPLGAPVVVDGKPISAPLSIANDAVRHDGVGASSRTKPSAFSSCQTDWGIPICRFLALATT